MTSVTRADDEIRTRDPHLGKVMRYQLRYIRIVPHRCGHLNDFSRSDRQAPNQAAPRVSSDADSWRGRRHPVWHRDSAPQSHGRLAQLVARFLHTEEVISSSPVSPTVAPPRAPRPAFHRRAHRGPIPAASSRQRGAGSPAISCDGLAPPGAAAVKRSRSDAGSPVASVPHVAAKWSSTVTATPQADPAARVASHVEVGERAALEDPERVRGQPRPDRDPRPVPRLLRPGERREGPAPAAGRRRGGRGRPGLRRSGRHQRHPDPARNERTSTTPTTAQGHRCLMRRAPPARSRQDQVASTSVRAPFGSSVDGSLVTLRSMVSGLPRKSPGPRRLR